MIDKSQQPPRACKYEKSPCIPLEHGFNNMNWRTYLDSYHDNIVCDFLEYGWPVNYTSQQPPRGARGNHPSATAYSSHVNAYLNTELQHGAMLGPFSESPFRKWFQTSPLMTRDKRSSDDRRVIIDLSWPTGYSVNDGIPPDVYMGTPYKLAPYTNWHPIQTASPGTR